MNYDFFRKQYDFGWEQRNSHNGATSIPLTILAVLASAASVMLVDFPYKAISAGSCTFTACGVIALILAAAAFFCIFRSYWGHLYRQLPKAEQLVEYQRQLFDFHKNVAEKEKQHPADLAAQQDFSYYLCMCLAEAADMNVEVNDRRAKYLHTAVLLIAIGIVCVGIQGALYAYAKATADDKVYQVELRNN